MDLNEIIEQMQDPSTELVEVNKLVAQLNLLLRDCQTVRSSEIITACQSVKSNLSYIEDWAWRKGKQNE